MNAFTKKNQPDKTNDDLIEEDTKTNKEKHKQTGKVEESTS